VPTLTDNDPPEHTRVRRLANVAFTPRRVAAMEPFVRDLTARSVEKRLSTGRADLVRDLAWDLPALVIFRVLGIPDEDVARVKTSAESRLLLMWGRPNQDEQIRLVQGMAAFWRYAETLGASRAESPRDDLTSDLPLARDGDLPALNHQEVTTIVYARRNPSAGAAASGRVPRGHVGSSGRDPRRILTSVFTDFPPVEAGGRFLRHRAGSPTRFPPSKVTGVDFGGCGPGNPPDAVDPRLTGTMPTRATGLTTS